MSDPISIMRRFVHEYQTAGNEAVADELLDTEFYDHSPFPGFGPAREDVKALFRALRAAFPDLRAEIVEQFADGDRVVTRKTFHGTHQGPFAGKAPSGLTVAIRVVDIVRIANGRIREHWNVVDVPGLMTQLG
jgi:predicted ester cyclase